MEITGERMQAEKKEGRLEGATRELAIARTKLFRVSMRLNEKVLRVMGVHPYDERKQEEKKAVCEMGRLEDEVVLVRTVAEDFEKLMQSLESL